jgi:uncharacterized protein YraI
VRKILSWILAFVLTITAVTALTPLGATAVGVDSTAGVISTSSGSLNVRSGASSSSSALTSLSKGSYITLLGKSGSWWKVEYSAGRTGYCYASYIDEVSGSCAAYVNLASGSVNVRSGAGTGYPVQTALSKDTAVVVISASGGWSRILYNGTKTGYVSSSYIQKYGSGSYSAVSLSVPSYKQTDSRWSGVALGTSGGTIGTIGCLTPALAMSESYRTGTTITPSSEAAKLTYTAGGSLYWPSNYTFSTSSGYLSTLYSLLRSGKPVLLGATGSYGQHWVVVTGYTGGGSLTASGFTINDPGSSSRMTLQQLLNSYPTFYKLAYYA